MLSHPEIRQTFGVQNLRFFQPQVGTGLEASGGVTSARLLHCASRSHNTQYVNKSLIYIIKSGNQFYTSETENRSRGFLAGDLITDEKLMDGEPTALWTGVGMDSARVYATNVQ